MYSKKYYEGLLEVLITSFEVLQRYIEAYIEATLLQETVYRGI